MRETLNIIIQELENEQASEFPNQEYVAALIDAIEALEMALEAKGM